MKKKFGLIGLLALGAYLLYASAAITMRASVNAKAAQQIRRDLIEQYPEIKCNATAGYESGVCLRVFGVIEPTKQLELRDWLVRWKTDNEMNVPIWLQFQDDENFEGSNSFDFARPGTFKL